MALTANGQTWEDVVDAAHAAGVYADLWLNDYVAAGRFVVGDQGFDWHGYELEYTAALLAAQAHLKSLVRGPQKAGVSDAPRVPCARFASHGFHPRDESCGWC